jgi:hypothetical protein
VIHTPSIGGLQVRTKHREVSKNERPVSWEASMERRRIEARRAILQVVESTNSGGGKDV